MKSIFEKIKDLRLRLTQRFPNKRYDNRFNEEVKAVLSENRIIQISKINEICQKYEDIIKRGH